MGLDTVELVMDVEDKFDIVIWDADYPCIVTVGDLHCLIVKRLQEAIDPQPEPTACPSMATFLKVRRFFVSAFNVGRSTIRPQSRLESLLPQDDRDSNWMKLAAHAELRLPRLRRTVLEDLAIFVGPLLVCGAPTVVAIAKDEPGVEGLTFNCGIIGYLIASSILSSRMPRTLLPVGCDVVGDLVKFAETPKPVRDDVIARYSAATNVIDADAVWLDLVQLICEQLGVKESEVKPESSFRDDLYCG